MKIGIDLSPVERDPAGIGQYSLSLFTELCKTDKKNSFIVYTTTPFLFANAQNKVIKVNKKLPAYGTRWMKSVADDAKNEKLDLFISPSNHLFTKLFPRTLQYVHDLAPLKYPKFFGRRASLKYRATLKLATANALQILTISQTIKDEILNDYPKTKGRINYIYPGLNKWIDLKSKDQNTVLDKYSIDYEYILTLCTLEPRKNHINMIKAFHLFKKTTGSPLKFVIIGKKGWYFEEIFKIVKDLNLENEVKFLGYVPNKDLNTIISKAKTFLFMSFYEGFGIPPIEALSLNVKTLVSDIPVFHEAYLDKVLYTDPYSTDKIANAIQQILDRNQKETETFVKDRYSWEKSAQKLLSIINEYK
jgi:glycosyltransferase involved in cell wall biosynthesis